MSNGTNTGPVEDSEQQVSGLFSSLVQLIDGKKKFLDFATEVGLALGNAFMGGLVSAAAGAVLKLLIREPSTADLILKAVEEIKQYIDEAFLRDNLLDAQSKYDSIVIGMLQVSDAIKEKPRDWQSSQMTRDTLQDILDDSRDLIAFTKQLGLHAWGLYLMVVSMRLRILATISCIPEERELAETHIKSETDQFLHHHWEMIDEAHKPLHTAVGNVQQEGLPQHYATIIRFAEDPPVPAYLSSPVEREEFRRIKHRTRCSFKINRTNAGDIAQLMLRKHGAILEAQALYDIFPPVHLQFFSLQWQCFQGSRLFWGRSGEQVAFCVREFYINDIPQGLRSYWIFEHSNWIYRLADLLVTDERLSSSGPTAYHCALCRQTLIHRLSTLLFDHVIKSKQAVVLGWLREVGRVRTVALRSPNGRYLEVRTGSTTRGELVETDRVFRSKTGLFRLIAPDQRPFEPSYEHPVGPRRVALLARNGFFLTVDDINIEIPNEGRVAPELRAAHYLNENPMSDRRTQFLLDYRAIDIVPHNRVDRVLLKLADGRYLVSRSATSGYAATF